MARTVRKTRVKEVPLSEVKDDLSRYLREATRQEILITRHGKPAGVLIGFESEEDCFEACDPHAVTLQNISSRQRVIEQLENFSVSYAASGELLLLVRNDRQ